MSGLADSNLKVPLERKFVYASAEIATEADRRNRLEDSLLAEKAGFNLARYTACAAEMHNLSWEKATRAVSPVVNVAA